MEHDDFLPRSFGELAVWSSNFAGKTGNYTASLGLPANDVAQLVTDNKNLQLLISYDEAVAKYDMQLTAAKDLFLYGDTPMPAAVSIVAPPALPAFVSPFLPGILGRIRTMAGKVNAANAVTDLIRQDLGLIGSELSLGDLKPALKIGSQAGHPKLSWKKGHTDALKIMVDRGTGTFVLVTISTKSEYVDNSPLPAYGQSALWKYKAIYLINDQEIGEWSDVVSTTVAGV